MVFEVRVLIPRYDPFQVDPFQSNLILGIKWISAGIPGSLLRAPIVFMFAGWLDFNYIAAPPPKELPRATMGFLPPRESAAMDLYMRSSHWASPSFFWKCNQALG